MMSAYLEPLEDGRCRKWKLVVSVGSGMDRRRKTRRFEGGKREAQAALREFEQGVCIPSSDAGFSEFANRWNDGRLGSGSISESTHGKYRWFIAAVSPYLTKNLEDVRPSDVTAAYAALRGSWSGTSLRSMHNSLVRIFRAAQDEGLVGSSPMSGVDAPKNDTKERRALSPEDAAALLDALDEADHRQFAVSLILRCGLRRGEVCGLEWRDVGDCLHVRREATKTDAGARDVPLDDDARTMVEARRKMVEESLEGAGESLGGEDRLCCGLDGRPLEGDVLRRWWERNRARFGLEGWTLHELRHTFLTNLAQAGVHPSVMQRLAGHSSMSTTLRIYTHVHREDMEAAMESLALVRKSAPESAPAGGKKKAGQGVLSS